MPIKKTFKKTRKVFCFDNETFIFVIPGDVAVEDKNKLTGRVSTVGRAPAFEYQETVKTFHFDEKVFLPKYIAEN